MTRRPVRLAARAGALRRRLPSVFLLATLAASAALGGCEVPLAPIDSGGRHFSMSGYLDTRADTSWIRVEPVAPTLDTTDDLIDVRVTVEGVERPFTQRVVTLRTGPAHLFWTTARFAPSQVYTVVAQRPDGAATRARVRMPDPTPPPVLDDGAAACPTKFTVTDAEAVIEAWVTYHVAGSTPPVYRFDRTRQLIRSPTAVEANAYYGSDALEMGLDPLDVRNPRVSSEIALAVVTSDWPAGVDLETLLIPTVSVTIENGVGFVGGATVWRRSFRPGQIVAPFAPPQPCFETNRGPQGR